MQCKYTVINVHIVFVDIKLISYSIDMIMLGHRNFTYQ